MATHEREIRTIVENWTAAVRDQDMARVLAHHHDDIVMYDVPMPLQARGMDAYRDTWTLFFGSNKGGPGSFDITELNVTAGDTVAFCHGFISIHGTLVRLTTGLVRDGDGWTITHEHHSYPIELD